MTSPKSSERKSLEAALAQVKVKPVLYDGIRLTIINGNGKAKNRFLTLSSDKFQLFTSKKIIGQGQNNSSLLQSRSPFINRFRNISSGSIDVIDIISINRIQPGQNTIQFENYNKKRLSDRNFTKSSEATKFLNKENSEENQCFSIIYGGQSSLAIMTDCIRDRNIIISTLSKLMETYQKAKAYGGKDALLLRYIWSDVDKDRSNYISRSEVKELFKKINFPPDGAEEYYNQFCRKIRLRSQDKSRGLTFDQCVTFFHFIRREKSTWSVKPRDLIWEDLFGKKPSNLGKQVKITAEKFLDNFLYDKQRQHDATIDTVKDIFRRFKNLETANLASNIGDEEDKDKYIDINRFEEYLNSRENDIFDPKKEEFDPMTMHEPLSFYWINSSHNTYLLGDQLFSQSSLEMYLVALHRGCRCVEIDIWDGQMMPKPVPMVTHGNTLTTKTSFTDVIEAISVFLSNNPDTYPIIFSLENHCTAPYQEVMAEELVRVFAGRLFIPEEKQLFEELPSPEKLKGKVILKGHRCDTGEVLDDDIDISVLDSDDGASNDTQYLRPESQVKPKTRVKICPALSRLTFFHGTKFKDFAQSKLNKPYQMHSFSERVANKLGARSRRDWIIYNQRNMSRTFPDGTRVLSGNYNPILAWSTGCQLVALNFQTNDPELRINDGRFRANGGCGYVLKPQNMLQDRYIESFLEPISLKVQVYSASRLPKPVGRKEVECISPYVNVTLWDIKPHDGKEIKKTYTTGKISSNGFSPIFAPHPDESSTFHFTVQSQNIAILQFSVMEGKDLSRNDDLIGSAAIPVTCIRNGYRSVQLFDANNTVSGPFDFANLLVNIKVERTQEEI